MSEGDTDPVAEGGVAAAQADHGGTDQGRVGEEDDQVLHHVEQKGHYGAENPGLASQQRVEKAGQQHGDGKDRRHDQHADG